MDDNMRVISTDEELKIFNDPYRMKIIKTFQKSGEPLTVKKCADIMGEVPAKVHYHVKKLIKIKILELDHIEVINGINAKYYFMPQESFTISLREGDDTNLMKQLAQLHSIMSNVIDDFKDSFMKSSAIAIEKKEHTESDKGTITSNNMYMTEEEYAELKEYITHIHEKYDKYKNREEAETKGRKKFTFIAGISKDYD